MNYRKVNNLVGWITCAIATFVYLITMERTVSFWDCGEFLSCAYKLEVGHSPGAPLFMMIQRMFGILAGGDLQSVAFMINAWSAIASGLTILFLFWTITHFAKRILARSTEPTGQQTLLIMGAGLVGGLAYAFSDTFWFSAVEAEVYATSSFFTALVFWAILKWEHIADQKHADRWLVFISYMMGLSVGVHLLNLLAIPAVAMVYYYRRYNATRTGSITAFVIGCVFLGLVQFGVLQGLPILASRFDIMFVNSFGMPFDSGALTFIVLLCGLLVWALIYMKKRGWYLAHTGMLCLIFIIIGFSSYMAPIIRSRADVPIDMTNPDNAVSLVSYIQREQFGQQPLLFGQDFTTRPVDYEKKGDTYAKSTKNGKDYYQVVGEKLEPVYPDGSKRFFPRIWDNNESSHIRFYQSYLGLAEGEVPTSADNFRFFFNYQINWMWWRYFMWNYSGRQNDFEGQGDPKNGNWITGIKPIDKGLLGVGDLNQMSDGYKDNDARNQLYMLPFILGIMGLIFQFNRMKEDGITTMVLFFFTGIAIAIYLNMPPLQPRERDYAFAGSTYAFAIWIGLGVLMVAELMQRAVKGSAAAYAAIALCLLAVPALMAKENWDDHDRSKKELAWSTAYNTLQSCDSNAILFTFGDNDTYPVWYLQEIEGVRKDVRVINLSLLGIDWYVDQMNYRINDADAVPMIWKRDDYIGDNHNYVRYYDNPQIPKDRYFNLLDIVEFMNSKDAANKLQTVGGESENYLPTKNLFLPSPGRDELIKSGLLSAGDTVNIDTDIKFSISKGILYKHDLGVLNIIAAVAKEGWKRPIYFGGGLPGDYYQGLDDYLRLEGVAYRLVPYKRVDAGGPIPGEVGFVNVDKSYNLFTKTFKWGNADRKDVYFDEKNRIMFAAYRINSGRLAGELNMRGEAQKAKEVLDIVHKNISEESYHYDATAFYMAVGYYGIKDNAKAKEMTMKLLKNAEDNINYTLTVRDDDRQSIANDVQRDLSIVNMLSQNAEAAGDKETAKMLRDKLTILVQKASSAVTLQ